MEYQSILLASETAISAVDLGFLRSACGVEDGVCDHMYVGNWLSY